MTQQLAENRHKLTMVVPKDTMKKLRWLRAKAALGEYGTTEMGLSMTRLIVELIDKEFELASDGDDALIPSYSGVRKYS